MPRIRTLAVKACRGIRESSLDFEGKSLILHGENGCGKSSFVDALELFFKGRINHLDEARSTSTKKHAPHIHFSEKDTKVIITTFDPVATLEWSFEGTTSDPNHQISFQLVGEKTNFILRRKQILDFIVTKPAGRYEQIAQVIGVTDLDEVELNLMRRRDELTEGIASLDAQQHSIENELLDKLKIEKVEEEEILGGLNIKLSELGQKEISSIEDIENHKLEAIKGTKDPKQIEKASKVQEAQDIITDFLAKPDYLIEHSPLWDAITELTTDLELSRAFAFQQVLAHSRDLISELKPDLCPVCEQSIDHSELLKRLDERLTLLEAAKEKSSNILRLKGTLTGELKELVRKVENLESRLNELDLNLDLSPVSGFVEQINAILTSIKPEPIKITLLPQEKYLDSKATKNWQSLLKKLHELLKDRLDNLMVTEKDRKALQAIDLLNSVNDFLKRISGISQNKRVKEFSEREIKTAYDLFVSTKQAEIQTIYDEIQKDMQRFYDMIHPNEDHREIKLEIDPYKRSSTEIIMGFHDRTSDPRAFQSEAHLDSLGLCTFLAFVKNFNTDFPLVVLDDVIGTIDSKHRRRVCELLFSEFKDHQVFITTHDELWFDELINYQNAMNVHHLYQNLRILDWSLDDGIRLDRHKPRWKIVEERLSEGDKVSAAAHSRRNLEWILLQMAISTKTKVAIKTTGGYVVSDLYDDFKKRFMELVPEIYKSNEKIFSQLEADGLFGNLLTHNNLKAENASIDEVRAFVNAVKRLHELVTCENEQFIEYHQSAKVMKCKCGHVTWNAE